MRSRDRSRAGILSGLSGGNGQLSGQAGYCRSAAPNTGGPPLEKAGASPGALGGGTGKVPEKAAACPDRRMADQEWLLNFVYSFINKPKHIFLVHGEEEGQEELKRKIEENVEIPVTIPEFGQTFELTPDSLEKLEDRPEVKKFNEKFIRINVLERIEKMKDDIAGLENIVRDENFEAQNDEMRRLSERIKEIELQIAKIMK